MPKDIIGARARIGTNPHLALLNTDALLAVFHDAGANPANIMSGQFSADINAPTFYNVKGRGTLAAPGDVASGDRLYDFQSYGYSGGLLFNNSNIRAYVDGAFVSGQAPPARLVFETGPANGPAVQQMAIFSSGFVGLGPSQVARGVSGQAGILHIGGNGTTQQLIERASDDITSSKLLFRKSRGTLAAQTDVVSGDQLGRVEFDGFAGANFIPVQVVADVDGAVTSGQMPPGAFRVLTAAANGALTNRLRVMSGGLVHIGDVGSANLTRRLYVVGNAAGTSIIEFEQNSGGATGHVLLLQGGDNATPGSDFLSFFRPDGTRIGDVDQNAAGTVAYNTTSDVRLKENIVDSEMGLSDLLQLRARRFNYKSDPNKQSMVGFIAQELHAVFPDAVSVGDGEECDCLVLGAKDAVTDEWNGKHVFGCAHVSPWGVDYGRITPLLVKSIQELTARVVALGG